MTYAPFVIVTATTEVIREVSRVRVNEAYTDALAAAGLIPIVLPPIAAASAAAALTDVAGLVLTGGEDIDPAFFGEAPHPATGVPHRARDAYELALARRAYELRVATLAICRGIQVMNVALGGSLVQDIPSQRESTINHVAENKAERSRRVHAIEIAPDSRLATIVGAANIAVNSSHHQAIAHAAPPLRIVARSSDGVIEAAEADDPAWWMIGVQWHPEELTTTPEDWDRRLFAAFAEEVRETSRD
jgi:putative glutamine amidotransferase